MSSYTITDRVSGFEIGIYAASTAREAVEAMHVDAGYKSTAHCARIMSTTVEALLAGLIVAVPS